MITVIFGILSKFIFSQLSKRKRLSAMEYDPSFPTTNPEEFEKNDIGL